MVSQSSGSGISPVSRECWHSKGYIYIHTYVYIYIHIHSHTFMGRRSRGRYTGEFSLFSVPPIRGEKLTVCVFLHYTEYMCQRGSCWNSPFLPLSRLTFCQK